MRQFRIEINGPRSGEDGKDGAEFQVCGTYDPNRSYNKLSIVMLKGSTFAASRDNPGDCPGTGWQLLALPGKVGDKGQPGPRGERGDKGERGEPGATIVSWQIDREGYRAIPFLSDGSPGATLDLRPFFEQMFSEVG